MVNSFIFGAAKMNIQSGYIHAQHHSLHYLQMGEGKKILLAFHGYHNSADLFKPFVKYLGDSYTILSFDLPHHGKTESKNTKPLSPKELVMIVEKVQEIFGIKKVSLAGYSMGGRICLKLIEKIPHAIDKVLLIAPDGLSFNTFYYFVTRTFIGKRLFKSVLTKSHKYLPAMSWAKDNRWVDESRYRFAMSYLQSDHARSFLLKVWPAMSRILPRRQKVRMQIKKHAIPLYIFMGYHDRIIPVSLAKRFQKGLQTVQVAVLNRGHRVFDAENLSKITSCLCSS